LTRSTFLGCVRAFNVTGSVRRNKRKKMAGQTTREFVSVLIPRTRDSRILLVNVDEKGLWMPTAIRSDGETFQTVANKLVSEVFHHNTLPDCM
jgi:hypothetical protein